MLLVSEVVTNAVLHARSDIELHLISRGRFVRVEVADSSTAAPVRRPHQPDSMTGRGLGLLDQLATEWGVAERGVGKVVWFEMSA